MFVSSDLAFWLYTGVAALVALVATWVVFWLIWQAARMVIVRVPMQALRGRSPRNLLSIAVALLLLPELLSYIFQVLRDVLQLPLAIVQAFGGLTNEWPDQPSMSYGANLIIGIFSTILKKVIDSLSLGDAPYAQLPLFVVLLIAAGWLFDRLSDYFSDTPQPAGQAPLYNNPQVVNIAFILIVVASLYLSLSALLAVPLMEIEDVADGFAVSDLDKHFQGLEPKREDIKSQYPDISTADIKIDGPGWSGGLAAGLRLDPTRLRQTIESWNGTREIVYIGILKLRTRGIENFRAKNAEGLGGREAVSHYSLMLDWYDSERTALENGLTECLTRARAVVSDIASVSHQQASGLPTDVDVIPLLNLVTSVDVAQRACDSARTRPMSPIPPRPGRTDDYFLIGPATAWLIDPASMPLIIIVGLVGFSFLGASVSRIVRIGAGVGIGGLSLSDVLQIIIGGATAALVVFLASYGGLAVLGDSSIDPNPYVVFVLCLIGALFSEDVWVWARQRLGQALNGQPDDGDQPPAH